MAQAGIGVDMLEISRMERALARHPSFAGRVFTPEEVAYCEGTARPAEHYALRFAAREAVLKALGCGFSHGVGLRDVSVTRDADGRPHALLAGQAERIAREQGVQEVALSLSRTSGVAVATALLITEDVRPREEEKPDPKEEIAATFKRARSVIDELERLQGGIMDGGEDDASDGAPEGEGRGPADSIGE